MNQVARQDQIPAQMERIASGLERLNHISVQLVDRMEPVLKVQPKDLPKQSESTTIPQPTLCPHAQGLSDLAEQIERIENFLSYNLSRAEI